MISAADILAARILIVDDDVDALRTLEQVLTTAGYSAVSVTTDPRLVLELHREHDFDAILLDVMMPRMTIRLQASNLGDAMSMWDRTVYQDRRTGPIDFHEMRNRTIGPIYSITFSGKF